MELSSNPEVPRKLPGSQPLSLGSLTPSPDSQKLSLIHGLSSREFHIQCCWPSQRIFCFLRLFQEELPTNPCMGHTPSTAGNFRKKFRKNSGKTPETLSERFLEFPSRVRLGCPKPYNSRHLRLPERFQNSLPPSTAGDASFFRIGSGEGLSELVMEFPAVLGVFLIDPWAPDRETPPPTGRSPYQKFWSMFIESRD